MKKVLSTILTLLLVSQMILTTPLTTFAASSANYKDEDVTWLGNSADYSRTLETVFDKGLRRVMVGDKSGIVDVTGTFIAPPIYDSIQVKITKDDVYDVPSTESIFLDGYVQVMRDNKMGLLNTLGEEVVPCKYDEVWLPVEGVCRVITDNKLGYWNIASNKEIVAPKYNLSICQWLVDSPERTYQTIVRIGANGKKIDTHPAWFDFNGGYALVPVSDAGKLGINGQIIDKNGKEILKTAYPFFAEPLASIDEGMHLQSYPQNGPYMVFQKYSTERLTIVSDQHYKAAVPAHLNSGLVGAKGVIIPAKYHGCIATPENLSNTGIFSQQNQNPKGDPNDYIYVNYSRMTVFPEFSMAVTYDAPSDDSQIFKTYGRLHSLVKFDGTVIKNILNARYVAANDVVIASDFIKNMTYVFYKNGTVKTYPNCAHVDPMIESNMKGYMVLDNRFAPGAPEPSAYLISIPSGKKSSYKFSFISDVMSSAGTFWAGNSNGKYGLVRVSDGKPLTAFAYEFPFNDVEGYTHFGAGEDQTSLVKKDEKFGLIDKNGKQIVPCKYEAVSYESDMTCSFYNDVEESFGRLETATGKIIVPNMKDSPYKYYGNNVILLKTSTRPITLDDVGGDKSVLGSFDTVSKYKLTDYAGKSLTDEYERINSPENGMISMDLTVKTGDLEGKNSLLVSFDGKPLCPKALIKDTLEYKITFVVANGKFGCIRTSALPHSTQPKSVSLK